MSLNDFVVVAGQYQGYISSVGNETVVVRSLVDGCHYEVLPEDVEVLIPASLDLEPEQDEVMVTN